MHEVRRAGSDRLWSRRWSRLHLLLIGVVSISLLAACGGGDDDTSVEDRRFATDPREPTSTATLSVPSPTPIATATGEPSTDVIVVASPTPAIVSTVTTVYAVADDAVIAVDTASKATRVLVRSTAEHEILRISPSADGEQVAILFSFASGTETRYDLEVRSKTGQELAAWSDIESGLDQISEPGKGRIVLDWSNSASTIAVAFPNGGAVLVAIGDQPKVLLKRSQAPAPVAMQWSPKGDAIAFVSKNANGDGSYLSIASVRALPVDPVKISGAGGDRPILSLVWMQDGSAVLAIQGSTSGSAQVGGDVIRIDRRTLKPTLVTGASLFGPAAQIVAVSPSPDGQAFAYVSVEPTNGGGWMATVWVMNENDPVQQRVVLDENPPVADIGWTASGLSVTLLEPDRVSVVTVDESGAVVGEAEATQIASPVAEPAGSPQASSPEPEATSESTPASPQP
ncbi:hypothetical protein BH09CHL1_BH09CHL1_26720 [soil metagenome]